MKTWEEQYIALIKDILDNGDDRVDRTGVGTRAVFGRQIRIDMADGFPMVTTKKMGFLSILAEALWFIEGSNDERRLAEIQYGSRDTEKTTIWTENANSDYWKPNAQFEGDLGRVYGVQWRRWKAFTEVGCEPGGLVHAVTEEIDQLKQVIDKLKAGGTDRRMLISSWNVGELNQMALPPCHMFFQFFLKRNGKLSLQMYQRSVDTFLGLPYNITSYALILSMVAAVTNTIPDELIMTLGDTHLYNNHFDQARTQIERSSFASPQLEIQPRQNIDDFVISDFKVTGYQSHPSIKAPMAV